MSFLGFFGAIGAQRMRLGSCAALLLASGSMHAATFQVDRTDDSAGAGAQVCGAGANDCSLRGAIIKANLAADADIITFAAATNGTPFTLTLVGDDDSAEVGDLDVNQSLTITGNGSSNTIIQAGTNTTNGIDKVLALNPTCAIGLVFTVSGVTLRFGRNTTPHDARFQDTGGGIDWCGSGTAAATNTFTLQNSVISDNSTLIVAGGDSGHYGGGLNIDEVAPSNGVVTITNTTFQNNQSSGVGGGINVFGDDVQLTISGSTISNNTTLATVGSGAQGGGINVRVTHQIDGGFSNPVPFVTINSTTISGNTARGFGGGVSVSGAGNQDVTIQNGSTISNNIVLNNGTISSEGGGLYNDGNAARTTTLSGVTISGNQSVTFGSGGAPSNPRGGGVAVNSGSVMIGGGTAINNNISVDGGGIQVRTASPNVTISGASITGNQAHNHGGGVHLNNAILLLGAVTIRGNVADSDSSGAGDGGGLYRNGGTLTLNNSIAIGGVGVGQGNRARNGGGIANVSGALTLSGAANNSLMGNQASANGGAVAATGGSVNLDRLVILLNSAGGNGGALFVDGASLTASLSRFAGNSAASGSGIFQSTGTALVENNWWACDGAPNAAGCQTGSGTFDADPRLDLRLTATPNSLNAGQGSTLQARVDINSAGTTLVPSPLVLEGLTVTFSSDALGTVTAPVTQSLSSGTASRPWTAGLYGGLSTVGVGLDSGMQTATITIQALVDLVVTKSDGTSTEIPGTPVAYSIGISNAGPHHTAGATVTDIFAGILSGCTWTCSALAGATCTALGANNINDSVTLPFGGSLTYTATCNISAAATGSLANTATVAVGGFTTDSNPLNNSATDTDTLTPRADLAITKTDGATTEVPGTAVTYTIAASNNGPSNAPGTTIADTFPAVLNGCAYTCSGSGGATGCTASGAGPIADSAANLPVGGTLTYVATCNIASGATGTLSNSASVAAAAGVTDNNAANNAATDNDTLTPQADLRIAKTNGTNLVSLDRTTAYTILVENDGPSNAVGATVLDDIPADLNAVLWDCVPSAGANCPPSGSGDINVLADIPAGGFAGFTATGTLNTSASTLTNTASVAAPVGTLDPALGNNSATDVDDIRIFADGFD